MPCFQKHIGLCKFIEMLLCFSESLQKFLSGLQLFPEWATFQIIQDFLGRLKLLARGSSLRARPFVVPY